MKQVKIYVIGEKIQAVVGNYLEVCKFSPTAYRVQNSGGVVAAFEQISLPVHQYRYVDGRPDIYVAIDPEVAEILAGPASQQVADAALAKVQEALRMARAAAGRIAAFLELPWYLRAWRALRRNI